MPRKTNPEKDVTLTPKPAARPHRASTTGRTRPQGASEAAEPARTPEKPAFVSEQALSYEEVARLAYSLWEARGGQIGNPEEDWLRAEEEIRQRLTSTER